jgi:hypothetical protein
MKTNLKQLAQIFLLLFLIISCTEDITSSYNESYAAFNISSATISESLVVSSADKVDQRIGQQFDVVISRSFTNVEAAQVVNFTLSSKFEKTTDFANEGDDASATFDLSIEGSNNTYSITIPAGEVSTSFFVRTINDLEASGDKILSLEITGAGNLPAGMGNSQINKKLTIRISDDDCPINLNPWVGIYKVEEQFTSGVNAPNGLSDFFDESYQMELALDPTDGTGTKVIWKNSAGFNVYFDANVVMSFVTCTKEVKFDAGPPRLAEFRNFVFTASSYDEAKLQIKCSGPLSTFGPYEFILTKK